MTHNFIALSELIGILTVSFVILCPAFCWVLTGSQVTATPLKIVAVDLRQLNAK